MDNYIFNERGGKSVGGYSNWHQSLVKGYESCKFYRLYPFINMLESIKDHRLANYLIRKNSFNEIQNIALKLHELPATYASRFPDGEEYICDAIGIWQTLLPKLRISLTKRSDETDQYSELIMLLSDLLLKARCHQDLVNRESFEKQMGLHWS